MAKTQLGMVFLALIITLKIAAVIHHPHAGVIKTNIIANKPKAAECVLSFVILIFGVVNISSQSYNKPSDHVKCDDADADIVGGGILIATWIQMGILSLIGFTGFFHFGATPIKEVGAGLLLTHVSLAIAMVVSLGEQNLSVQDAILGSMVLDGQNAALSLQLLTKEILASRWQTAMVLAGQLLGLVIEGIVVDAFRRNSLAPKGCQCLRVFWWVWFSNCDTPEPNDIYPFWCYFALRCGLFLEGLWIAWKESGRYHNAEKKERENPCSLCQRCASRRQQHPAEAVNRCPYNLKQCKRCSQCDIKCNDCSRRDLREANEDELGNHRHYCENCNGCEHCNWCRNGTGLVEGDGWLNGRKYSQTPATVSAIIIHRAFFALLSMASTLYTIATYSMKASANMNAVGQVAAMVIGAGTTLRVLWVAYHSCYP